MQNNTSDMQTQTETESTDGFIVLTISELRTIVKTMKQKNDTAISLDVEIKPFTFSTGRKSKYCTISKSWIEYTKGVD